MNKKLLSAFAAFFLVFTLAACGGDTEKPETGGDTSEQTGEETAGEKKVLNLLETSNIPSLVPWKATDEVSFTTLGNVLEGLVVLGENGSIHPGVAESWDVSEDGLTYTFHLREDAKWIKDDGSEYGNVTANDFVYSWKKLIDPTSGSQYNFMISTAGVVGAVDALTLAEYLVAYDTDSKALENLSVDAFEDGENGTAQEQYDQTKIALEESVSALEAEITSDGTFATVDDARAMMTDLIDALGVKAVDDYTLEVTLAVPTPYFLTLMAFPSFYPVNEAFVNEVTEDKFGTSTDTFLYNGAFTFTEWKISQRHYWEKNQAYWDVENVAIDAIDFRVVEGIDNNTSVGMYTKGDIMSTGLSGENVAKYGSRPDAIAQGTASVWYLEVNHGVGELTPTKQLLSNPKARQAINMVINKSFVTDNIFANGAKVADYFVPSEFAFGPEGTKYEGIDFRESNGAFNSYNVEEAQKLWNEAREEEGITGDIEINFVTQTGETSTKIAAAVRDDMLANLEGISDVAIEQLPFSEKLDRSHKGEFDLLMGGWSPDYSDPMTFLDMFVSNGGHNTIGYSNPEYDKLISDAKIGELTANPEARWEALLAAEEILIGQDQALIPLWQSGSVGLRDKNILNLYTQQVGPNYFYKWVDLNTATN